MGFESFSFLNKGKVFTEVTDERRAFQTVGAARLTDRQTDRFTTASTALCLACYMVSGEAL